MMYSSKGRKNQLATAKSPPRSNYVPTYFLCQVLNDKPNVPNHPVISINQNINLTRSPKAPRTPPSQIKQQHYKNQDWTTHPAQQLFQESTHIPPKKMHTLCTNKKYILPNFQRITKPYQRLRTHENVVQGATDCLNTNTMSASLTPKWHGEARITEYALPSSFRATGMFLDNSKSLRDLKCNPSKKAVLRAKNEVSNDNEQANPKKSEGDPNYLIVERQNSIGNSRTQSRLLVKNSSFRNLQLKQKINSVVKKRKEGYLDFLSGVIQARSNFNNAAAVVEPPAYP